MKLNCKPGDLAVIVRSSAGNEGKIVRCLELIPADKWLAEDGRVNSAPTWRIDIALRGWAGDFSRFVRDEQVRPIRDNDGEDETLQWVPRKVTA